MYLSLRIPSLSAPLALAKLFAAKLVSLSKDLNIAIQNYESTFAENVKQILCNVLLKMYQIGMTESIDRLQDWSDTVARANDDGHVTNMTTIKDSAQDCIFTRADALVDNLSKANECWKAWSLIANCIHSHFQFLSSTNETEIVYPETMYFTSNKQARNIKAVRSGRHKN